MIKGIIIVIVLLALVGGSVFFIQSTGHTVVPSFEWQFNEAGLSEESSVPMTQVTLAASNGEFYHLGTFEGTCFKIIGSSWELLENEIAGAICWMPGGGKEIGVFQEAGKLVVKVGDVEEGTAEEPGMRGNFEDVIEIKL